MSGQSSVAPERAQWLKALFPGGVPALWCPPVTHYDRDGAIDGARIAAHLRHLSPYVKGFLIPGSTGDGWKLSDAEFRQLLEIALDLTQELDLHLLIGILKSDAAAALKSLRETVNWIESRAGEVKGQRLSRPPGPAPAAFAASALGKARVCGFAVCAPRGKEVSQEEMSAPLASILEAGLPTALYQLPQMTQNEVSPEVASSLALRFPNFVLFKDSSGADRVVLSGKPLAGVFTMRGGESDYAGVLKSAGGHYDGFLLGSANCFARELDQLINDVSAKRFDPARQMSERLAAVAGEVYRVVTSRTNGIAFGIANKAIDHFFAYGPRAAEAQPPRLHGGNQLPVEIVRATGEILSRHGLLPVKGYLSQA